MHTDTKIESLKQKNTITIQTVKLSDLSIFLVERERIFGNGTTHTNILTMEY